MDKPNHINIWNFIKNKYAEGYPVVLLSVLQSEGSSPGRQGFKMAVAADGDFHGTIGGGIMEHKFVEMAKARLGQGNEDPAVHKQVHNKEAGKDQSGMICSGEQTIFLYHIQETDLTGINAIITSITNNENGTLQLSNSGILYSNSIPPSNFYFEQTDEEFIYTEKTGFKNILHIIGGGHCALALSRLMSELDFYIHVYDERQALNTLEQNNYAHAKKMVGSYADIHSRIQGGENVYVVVMTFGYRTDDIAIRALLDKKFKYFGILGSKKKMEKMFTEYRKENINENILSLIHAPVGIQIKSQTSAEIAVSIAAEIIGVKNG